MALNMEPTIDKKEYWIPRLSSKRIVFVTLLNLTILTVSLILLIISINNREECVHRNETILAEPTNQSDDSPVKLAINNKVRILSRAEWLARPPVVPANPLKTPIALVIIVQTATENCTTIETCKARMKDIQNFHMDSNGWWDIGYNFAVGGDGYVYEGRGWTSEAAHTYGFNHISIGIAFIGTFINIKPPDWQVKAALDLMEKGVELNYLSKDFKVIGQNQLQRTQSSGDELYKIMKNWTHWSENP